MKEALTSTPANAVEPAINTEEWACRDKYDRLYPAAEWEFHWLFNKATSIDHPFLNEFVKIKAHVCIVMGEWVIIGYDSLAMVHVYKDFINLECIATPSEFRKQGSGTKLMKALVAVSDETGIPIRLRACLVTGHGWNGIPNHPVIQKAIDRKNKIPVRDLPKWCHKFGFVTIAQVFRKGKAHGWNMLYSPKKNNDETTIANQPAI